MSIKNFRAVDLMVTIKNFICFRGSKEKKDFISFTRPQQAVPIGKSIYSVMNDLLLQLPFRYHLCGSCFLYRRETCVPSWPQYCGTHLAPQLHYCRFVPCSFLIYPESLVFMEVIIIFFCHEFLWRYQMDYLVTVSFVTNFRLGISNFVS